MCVSLCLHVFLVLFIWMFSLLVCLILFCFFFPFAFVFTLFLDACLFFNEKEKEMDLCGWGGEKDLGGVVGGEPQSKSSACKRIFKKFLHN